VPLLLLLAASTALLATCSVNHFFYKYNDDDGGDAAEAGGRSCDAVTQRRQQLRMKNDLHVDDGSFAARRFGALRGSSVC
jgi:hypothetical protein